MRSWLRKMCGLRTSGRGQTTAEYAIIIALLAIASIAVLTIFGNNIRELIGASSRKLGGDASGPNYQQPTQDDTEGSTHGPM